VDSGLGMGHLRSAVKRGLETTGLGGTVTWLWVSSLYGVILPGGKDKRDGGLGAGSRSSGCLGKLQLRVLGYPHSNAVVG
jgi:hypothetical protein